ncbi:hypothetical protein JCM19235_3230 [Vibrio maritimus]|uniref:Uncharacterized protein n=1 Tax=Vibrio maritimus TaxID=990268 RepID=A0A090S4J4_9VIBR|nr:hypothetical protein JCM19235_3230 [Vibrio maritimus]
MLDANRYCSLDHIVAILVEFGGVNMGVCIYHDKLHSVSNTLSISFVV